jgi:SOS-response transcriptional repressor LexA
MLGLRAKDRVDTLLNNEFKYRDADYDRLLAKYHDLCSRTVYLPWFEHPTSTAMGVTVSDMYEQKCVNVPFNEVPSGASFLCNVVGDGMEPDYCEGDIVFVKLVHEIPIGEIGLYNIDGRGVMRVEAGDRLMLPSGRYPDIMKADLETVIVTGMVVGKWEHPLKEQK